MLAHRFFTRVFFALVSDALVAQGFSPAAFSSPKLAAARLLFFAFNS
jgi:hypothetical protein